MKKSQLHADFTIMLSSGDTSVVCLQTHYSNSLDINDPKATTHEMHNRFDEVRQNQKGLLLKRSC